ncbi:peptide-methionine (R)-S-oxide reductase MsrB [Mucilaginibacter sabulilitoris]|uniref:peptide-methionine (R)-S-oxide reductase n=1 Tax=Mucilaginibacter sabulilitoris TaxID=1173583 RepID=A0ABZ0TV31_9SPHI|nr:peptide-methionine (R)-S-oxide reductase MsrB [Mucilaginibacter sabulilitoris]WPU96961.1 peptide-methionine (R)-S-oxide reductase MsrB [Mucilaginibacter sabulilitoris]
MKKIHLFLAFMLIILNVACQSPRPDKQVIDSKRYPDAKPDSYWKKKLSPEAYNILVNRGTEPPFKNPYWNNHQKGVYVSAATGKPLFTSDDKFESGTGWPSFTKPINDKDISIVKDTSFGLVRDEVVESSTGLHLGHLFDDGPAPTFKRFCMDSYAFKFIPAEKKRNTHINRDTIK